MNPQYDDTFDDLELFDEETMLYNHVVFSTFLRSANLEQLLPMSLLLIRLGDHLKDSYIFELAGLLQDMSENNFILARISQNELAVCMARTLECDAYGFLENYSQRLRESLQLRRHHVKAVIKTWENPFQTPLDFYRCAQAELDAGIGMDLKFVGNTRLRKERHSYAV